MLISNKLTEIKLVMLSTKKKTKYYLNKKIFKNKKKYITSSFNQPKFFLCSM